MGHICLNEEIPFQQIVINIVEKFKKINPIVFVLFIFLVVSPIQEYYNSWVIKTINSTINNNAMINEERLKTKNIVIKKEVTKEIYNTVDDTLMRRDIFNNFRFVDVDCLNVRTSDSINSRIVGKLYFGQVVKIIYKIRNWTLIEYIDDSEDICIKGWVFTRYIKRFN